MDDVCNDSVAGMYTSGINSSCQLSQPRECRFTPDHQRYRIILLLTASKERWKIVRPFYNMTKFPRALSPLHTEHGYAFRAEFLQSESRNFEESWKFNFCIKAK